jgi:hypothetical protein
MAKHAAASPRLALLNADASATEPTIITKLSASIVFSLGVIIVAVPPVDTLPLAQRFAGEV